MTKLNCVRQTRFIITNYRSSGVFSRSNFFITFIYKRKHWRQDDAITCGYPIPITCPLWKASTIHGWTPIAKGQQCGASLNNPLNKQLSTRDLTRFNTAVTSLYWLTYMNDNEDECMVLVLNSHSVDGHYPVMIRFYTLNDNCAK